MRECESCGRCLDDDATACCEAGGLPVQAYPGPRLLDGKYLLERRLGAGGMGAVYQALHTGLGKLFAVKVIRSPAVTSPQAIARFRIEAQALGRLSHPHVVGVSDYGVDPRDGGLPYLVMEYLRGESLLAYIQRHGPLEPAEAVRLLAPGAAALDDAHAQGILHRDLKPSNVFLASADDGSLNPKLLDFGLARFAGVDEPPLPDTLPPSGSAEMPTVRLRRLGHPALPSPEGGLPTALTAPEGIVGTPQFFAPELIEGSPPSRATDLWAFGILAYATLTGRLPFEGPADELLAAILDRPPAPPSLGNPRLSPHLDDSLLAPFERDPARRPASATAWIEAVDRAVRALEARRLRAQEAPRRLLLASGIALGMLLLGATASPLAPFAAVDGAVLDAFIRLAPPRAADPRLLLVTIDEATLHSDATPLSARGDAAGILLERAFSAGAAGVALDLLLPPAWGASPAFGRSVVAHADRLAFAALSGADGAVVGPEALGAPVALALGDRASALFGFANLAPDRDGTVRRARAGFRTRDGTDAPSFAARALSFLDAPKGSARGTFLVDHRIDVSGLDRLSFHGAEGALAERRSLAEGRLLLVGAEFEGSGDLHPNPRDRGRPLTGLELQALVIQTLLEGTPLGTASRLVSAAVALPPLFVVSFALLWMPSRVATALALAGALVVPSVTALAAFLAAGLVLPVAAPTAALVLAGALAAATRLRLPSLAHPSQEV